MAEQLADGNATPAELEVAYRAAEVAWDLGADDDPWEQRQLYIRSRDEENRDLAERWVACAAMHTAELKCWFGFEDTERAAEAEGAGDWHYMRRDAAPPSPRAEARIFRDIFGVYFHPVQLDPSWLAWNNGAIRKMAQVIYDARAFDRLPLLADALEDAGCTDAAVLSHCREPGEHVRGCWVVDLLLGKS